MFNDGVHPGGAEIQHRLYLLDHLCSLADILLPVEMASLSHQQQLRSEWQRIGVRLQQNQASGAFRSRAKAAPAVREGSAVASGDGQGLRVNLGESSAIPPG
jgi:hypothetical protein